MSDALPAFDVAAFEARKRASFVQVLFRAARLCNEEGIRRVRAAVGDTSVRTAHTALFPHIPFAGIRLTELAARVGVSKQAVQQLVDELEAMGLLAREPDPSDGRAKRIVFTDHGKAALLHGLGVLDGIGAELQARVGAAALATAHDVLLAAIEVYGDGDNDASRR